MIISIILSLLTIFFVLKNNIYLGNKLGIIDEPNRNKVHKTNVPLLGGPTIFIVLLIFLFLNLKSSNFNINQFVYLFLLFILGFIDDKINLNSNFKIIFVILFSAILIFLDESFLIHKIYFEISNNEYYFGKLKIPVTLFCILLLYIAMNMSDGINCLLISFSIFALFTINIFIFKFALNIFDIGILFSLIFIIYLNYKNIIFLGNSGASLLASYFIYKLISTNYFNQIDVFEVISIFLVMGIDMVRLVITRLLRKKNPFARDLNHFHHLLIKKFNLFSTIIIYLILSFGPIIISKMINIPTLFIVPFSIIFYFILIKKLN